MKLVVLPLVACATLLVGCVLFGRDDRVVTTTLRPTTTATTSATETETTTKILSKTEFRETWARAGAKAVETETMRADRFSQAVEHIRQIAPEAQRSSIAARKNDYPSFSFWIQRTGWEDVVHPLEFWGEAVRRALPGYRIQPQWYNTPTQYVYVSAFADA